MPDGKGSAASTAVFTKAVVATCVVLVPALAVGEVGVPVRFAPSIDKLSKASTTAAPLPAPSK